MAGGGKGGSSAKPPSAGQLASGQNAYSIYDSMLGNQANMVNQTTPFGTVNYNPTAYETVRLPWGKNEYDVKQVPTQWSAQTNLTPQAQQLLDTYMSGMQGMGQTGLEQLGRVQGMLSQPFDLSGVGPNVDVANLSNLPQAYSANWGTLGAAPDLQGIGAIPTSFTPTPDFTPTEMGQYAIDEGAQQKMLDALMGQMQPQTEQDRAALETKLANQGVSRGSTAYTNAMQQLEDQVARNRQGATVTADEQARADALARLQAQQGISGENRANYLASSGENRSNYLANLQGALSGNQDARSNLAALLSRRGQLFGEEAQKQQLSDSQRANIWNLLTGQQNAQQSARQQATNEALMQRQIPMQELSQLFGMAGGGLQMPTQGMAPVPQVNVQTPNYAGGAGLEAQSQLAQQQQQQAMWQQLMGGLFGLGGGLGGAAILASDRRLKDNIRHLKTVETTAGPLSMYSFTWRDTGQPDTGFMADEVRAIDPDAVIENDNGYLMVDYGRLLGAI